MLAEPVQPNVNFVAGSVYGIQRVRTVPTVKYPVTVSSKINKKQSHLFFGNLGTNNDKNSYKMQFIYIINICISDNCYNINFRIIQFICIFIV